MPDEAAIIGAALDTMPDAFVVYDLEGRPLRWNRAYSRITGYSDDEIGSMKAWDFHPEEEIGFVAASFRQVVENDEPMYISTRVKRKDGERVPCLLSGSLIKGEDGEPLALCGVGRDMTEQKRVEEELRRHRENLEELVQERTAALRELNRKLVVEISEREQMEKELRRLNRELEGYAHTVSHELRTPLSGIYLALEWLQRLTGELSAESDESEVESIAQQAMANVERAELHIKNLLALAEAGQVPRKTEEVAVSEVVAEILQEMELEIADRDVRFRVDGDLGSVRADRTQIYQLFLNLIENALLHNDRPGLEVRIELLGKDPGGYSRYLVKDNGRGIDSEESESIFLPFFRGEKGSTGIGLATVAKIVKVYGGEVGAYNDGGACFEFAVKDFDQEQ